jgi:hypothetical protein
LSWKYIDSCDFFSSSCTDVHKKTVTYVYLLRIISCTTLPQSLLRGKDCERSYGPKFLLKIHALGLLTACFSFGSASGDIYWKIFG